MPSPNTGVLHWPHRGPVSDHFLTKYFHAFRSIEGWFSFDAALAFMAYNQLIAAEGIAGDVLEIGVHHGLSAIAVASLRAPGAKFVAVDLFETQQDKNVSGSGSGNLQVFLKNMQSFYDDLQFLRPVACASPEIRVADTGKRFSFCNIDGGHSQDETYHDLCLSYRILIDGGLVALDDYFNPSYPGVCEGAALFMQEEPGRLKPVAAGYNKVLFQKLPCAFDLNARFEALFPRLPRVIATMWKTPTWLLDRCPLRAFVDFSKSEPTHIVPASETVFAVDFEFDHDDLTGVCGQEVMLCVKVTNRSTPILETVYSDIGLTYHLRTSDGSMVAWDNDRVSLTHPLKLGRDVTFELPVRVPEEPGSYLVEIDLVWENVMWFHETGNQTAFLRLTAKSAGVDE